MTIVRLAATALVLSAVMFGFAGSGPAATSTSYVALGDSYSSGVGTCSYTLNSTCNEASTRTRTCTCKDTQVRR